MSFKLDKRKNILTWQWHSDFGLALRKWFCCRLWWTQCECQHWLWHFKPCLLSCLVCLYLWVERLFEIFMLGLQLRCFLSCPWSACHLKLSSKLQRIFFILLHLCISKFPNFLPSVSIQPHMLSVNASRPTSRIDTQWCLSTIFPGLVVVKPFKRLQLLYLWLVVTSNLLLSTCVTACNYWSFQHFIMYTIIIYLHRL